MGWNAYLCNGEADEFSCRTKMCICSSQNGKHQRTHQESLDLNPSPSKYLNQANGEEIARYISRDSNDQVSNSIPH